MVQVIENLRLTHRDATVRFIYELACQHAATAGERVPSLFQVRSICQQIPAPVRLLADGREAEFRNRYRLTYPIAHDPKADGDCKFGRKEHRGPEQRRSLREAML